MNSMEPEKEEPRLQGRRGEKREILKLQQQKEGSGKQQAKAAPEK